MTPRKEAGVLLHRAVALGERFDGEAEAAELVFAVGIRADRRER